MKKRSAQPTRIFLSLIHIFWHSNTKYKRTVWQCNNKFKHEEKCGTPHLYEAEIQKSFVKALSLLLADKEKLLIHCRELKDELTDCSTEEARLEELSQAVSYTHLKVFYATGGGCHTKKVQFKRGINPKQILGGFYL